MGTKFRNRLRKYNDVSNIISGLLTLELCSLTAFQSKDAVKVDSIDRS
jgi:hypothetical protein